MREYIKISIEFDLIFNQLLQTIVIHRSLGTHNAFKIQKIWISLNFRDFSGLRIQT